MKVSIFNVLFALGIMVTLVTSKLTVLSPQTLATKFNRKGGIDFTVKQFGKFPYGAHLVGKLVLSNPPDACQSITSFIKGENLPDENIIVIALGGGCSDGIKILNAEESGVKMLVLVNEDDKLPDSSENIQTNQESNIPTIIISKKNGDKIVEFLMNNKDSQKPQDSAFLSIVFPQDQKKTVVNIDLWFSSADTFGIAFRFLHELKDTLRNQADAFIFNPHYVTWTCGRCRAQEFNVKDSPDCISGGRYCAPDPDNEGPLTGKDIVMEDLKQICIWKTDPKLWWDYALKFERCLPKEQFRDCSIQLLNEVATGTQLSQINECVQKSFIKHQDRNIVDQDLDDNEILKNEKETQIDYDVTTFPIIYINYKQYNGKLTNLREVQKVICNQLIVPTSFCQQILEDGSPNSRGILKHILYTILIVAVCGLVIILCYRRIGKRENRQIAMEANNLVYNYFALQDKSLNEETK